MTAPMFYAKLGGHRHRLEIAPAVASWDKAGSPGMARVAAFTGHACSVVADRIAATPEPLSVSLDIGLPDDVPLLALNDVDNYLFPLVQALTKRTERQFASVWATKRHAAESYITVGATVSVADPGGGCAFDVTTLVSSEKRAYKEAIRDQVATASQLPDGAVALQLAFAVGPRRSWPNLWKPTIDALGSILGHGNGAGEWDTRDGRIAELGLHCIVDPERRHDVAIAIRTSSAAP